MCAEHGPSASHITAAQVLGVIAFYFSGHGSRGERCCFRVRSGQDECVCQTVETSGDGMPSFSTRVPTCLLCLHADAMSLGWCGRGFAEPTQGCCPLYSFGTPVLHVCVGLSECVTQCLFVSLVRSHFGSSRCWTSVPQRLEPRWSSHPGQVEPKWLRCVSLAVFSFMFDGSLVELSDVWKKS